VPPHLMWMLVVEGEKRLHSHMVVADSLTGFAIICRLSIA
jgi:hypothetical protein